MVGQRYADVLFAVKENHCWEWLGNEHAGGITKGQRLNALSPDCRYGN